MKRFHGFELRWVCLALAILVLGALPFAAEGGPQPPAHYAWSTALAGTDQLSGVAWDGVQFVAVGDKGAVYTSQDGSSWTKVSAGTAQPVAGLAMGDDKLVAAGTEGLLLARRGDGQWDREPAKTDADLSALAYAPIAKKHGLFVAVGAQGALLTSKDGREWKEAQPVTTSDLKAVAWGGLKDAELFVAVGNGGTILSSADGKKWNESRPFQNDLLGVAWGGQYRGERFVAVGQNGSILVSDAGLAWTPVTSGTDKQLNAVAWCGSRFVAAGASGTILTSCDGLAWYPEESPTNTWLNSVTAGPGNIVIVGESGMAVVTATYAISGKASRTVTGVGVGGLTVNLTGGAVASTATASDGTYAFANLASGAYTVDIPNTSANAFYPHLKAVAVTTTDVPNINFTVYPLHRLSGIVTPAPGNPPGAYIHCVPSGIPFGSVDLAIDDSTGVYDSAPGNFPEGAWTITPMLTAPSPGHNFVFDPTVRYINLTADAVYNWTAIAAVNISGGIANLSPCLLDRVDITATALDGSGTYSIHRFGEGTFPDVPNDVPPLTVAQNKAYSVSFSSAGGTTPDYTFNPSPQTVTVSTSDFNLTITWGTPFYTVHSMAWYLNTSNIFVPLPGATVTLKQGVGVAGTCSTGPDGMCTIAGAEWNQDYTIEASKPGYYFFTTWFPTFTQGCDDFYLPTATPPYPPVAPGLYAIPAFNVSGRVTYQGTTSGVGGVTVSTTSGADTWTTMTASDGTYTLTNLHVGAYNINFSKGPGWTFAPNPVAVTIFNESLSGVDATALGTYTVSGDVRCITTTPPGDPIPAVTVTASVPGIGSFTQVTGAAGTYSIIVPPANPVTITAARTGYTFIPAYYEANTTGGPVGARNFTATCPGSTYSISGKVVNTSAVGLAGVTVTAAPGLTATTAADGSYTIANLAPGTYTVTPTRADYVFAPIWTSVTLPCAAGPNCTAGSASAVNFTAYHTWSVNGNASVAGATITATHASQPTVTVTSLPGGDYTVPGLINGTWRITPTKTGYVFTNTYQDVLVNDGNLYNINFNATPIPTYTISGNVYDLSNNPVVGATLTASSGQTTTSVAGGAYTLTGFVNGTYTIFCTYSGLTFVPQAVTINSANRTGIDFHATTGWTISGTVTSGGTGLGGVTVTATLGGVPAGAATTAANGTYTIGGLSNGTYTVSAALAGHTFLPVSQNATVNSANVTGVNFQEGFSVTGRVTLASSGAPLAGVVVSTLSGVSGTSAADGYFTLYNLAPGNHTLTPAFAGFSFSPATHVVTITNANLYNQDFLAYPMYTIGGRATLSGSGLSGVLITITQGGATVDTQYTGAAGYYTSKLLAPGNYIVTPALAGYDFNPTASPVELTTFNQTAVNFFAGAVAPPPKPTSVSPGSGTTLGGTDVTITGTGFLSGATVTFDASAAASVVVVSDVSITCKTPAHAAGAVAVTVKNPDDQVGTLAGGFTYVTPPAPTVTNVNPASGPAAGGTKVTITGTNFLGATAVKFGIAAAAFTVDTATQITATSPPGTAGTTVDVLVTTPGGTSAVTAVGKFTYLAPGVISIQSVTPGTGPIAGGTGVTIMGTAFASGATVTFDTSLAGSVVVVGDSQITCVTPAHAAGLVNVTVKNPDNQSATLTNGYRYGSPAPIPSSVSPGKGSTLGQATVTILGSNFITGAGVTFGGTAATNVNVVNPATITCTTPPHAAGTANVVVTNPDGLSGTLTSAFTYITPPVVTAIKKYKDPFRLKLNGTNFHTNCTIKINGVAVPVTDYKQSTKLFAKGGASLKAMVPKGVTVQITVVNNDDGISSLGLPYTR